MGKSIDLHNARQQKRDEFYTQYEDIEEQIETYYEYDKNVFKDKIILLPCDNPKYSNFTKYFVNNFKRFGIRKLISTCYQERSKNNLFNTQKYETRGKIFTLEDYSTDLDINNLPYEYLQDNGDFRTREMQNIIEGVDIVITNPPFSLFREFIKWIVDNNTEYIILGSYSAITCDEVFIPLQSRRMWLGNEFKGGATYFINEHYTDYVTTGKHYEGKIRISRGLLVYKFAL